MEQRVQSDFKRAPNLRFEADAQKRRAAQAYRVRLKEET